MVAVSTASVPVTGVTASVPVTGVTATSTTTGQSRDLESGVFSGTPSLVSTALGPARSWFSGALEWVCGEPDTLIATGQQYLALGGRISALSTDLATAGQQLPNWQGPAASRFHTTLAESTDVIDAVGGYIAHTDQLLQAAAEVAKQAADAIWDLVTELVSWLCTTLVKALAASSFSLGASIAAWLSTAVAQVGRVVGVVAQLCTKVGQVLMKIVGLLQKLVALVTKYQGLITKIQQLLATVKRFGELRTSADGVAGSRPLSWQAYRDADPAERARLTAPAGSTLPGSSLPGSSLPGSTLPGSTLPGSTLPGSTLPGSSSTVGASGPSQPDYQYPVRPVTPEGPVLPSRPETPWSPGTGATATPDPVGPAQTRPAGVDPTSPGGWNPAEPSRPTVPQYSGYQPGGSGFGTGSGSVTGPGWGSGSGVGAGSPSISGSVTAGALPGPSVTQRTPGFGVVGGPAGAPGGPIAGPVPDGAMAPFVPIGGAPRSGGGSSLTGNDREEHDGSGAFAGTEAAGIGAPGGGIGAPGGGIPGLAGGVSGPLPGAGTLPGAGPVAATGAMPLPADAAPRMTPSTGPVAAGSGTMMPPPMVGGAPRSGDGSSTRDGRRVGERTTDLIDLVDGDAERDDE